MASRDEKRGNPRANLQWLVTVFGEKKVTEGITKDISPLGAYICCTQPLMLNEICDISFYGLERSLRAKSEVVWSNRHGPDDEVNPRGMGVRFLQISGDDRMFIAQAVMEHGKHDKISPEYLKTLETEVKKK